MKKITLSIILSVYTFMVYAESPSVKTGITEQESKEGHPAAFHQPELVELQNSLTAQKDSAIIDPQFPGGIGACMQWLKMNIQYPEIWAQQGIKGKVYIEFVVEKDGSITNYNIKKSPHPYLSEEAKRLIGHMPKWTPGKVGGEPVRVKLTLPINFSLDEQESSTLKQSTDNKDKEEAEDTDPIYGFGGSGGIYDVVEENPKFPGGEEACMLWLEEHIQYQKAWSEQRIAGRVYAQFIVNEDGSLSDIKIVRSPFPELCEEALRVLSEMPKWSPGKQRGKPVRVKFSLPVVFRTPME